MSTEQPNNLTNLQNHPAAFNPNDPSQWVTLATGIAQIIALFWTIFHPTPPTPPQS